MGSGNPGRPILRSPVRAALLVLAAAAGLTAAPLLVAPFAREEAGDNILVAAHVRTVGTMGLVESILRGPLAPESDLFRDLKTMRVAAGSGSIEFEFEQPTELAALVVQAAPDDVYGVEASADGGITWRRIWTVTARKQSGSSFANRQTQFEPAVVMTHLRLRNEAPHATLAAISALRGYSALPAGWPDLGPLQSPALRASFPWTLRHRVVSMAKFAVALVATTLLLACSPRVLRRLPERTRPWLERGAIIASLVAGLGWWNLLQLTAEGPSLRFENYWDVYHYYMAGKYAPELGHTRLYDCYLAAELEDGLAAHQLRRRETRDLTDDELVSTSLRLTEAPDRCKPHFSPERWADWKHDHEFFRTRMRPYFWVSMLMDHGFNGSPAWLLLARPLASLGPMSDASFYLLISADTLLFVLMWYVAWSTFGWRAACLGIVFWGTNYLAGSYFTLGAFLRHDWLFLTVAGICWVRQERMFLAGAALAYATMLRVFPAFVVLALLMKIGCELIRSGKLELQRPHRRLIGGGVTATLLIGVLSVQISGRATAWQDFTRNLIKHQSTEKAQQVGLPSLMRYSRRVLELIPPDRVPSWLPAGVMARSTEPLGSRDWTPLLVRAALTALLLPLFTIAIWREEQWVAAVLGIGLIPIAGDISNYYCVILLAYAFLAVRRESAAVGFAVLTVLLSGLCLVFGLAAVGTERLSLLYPVGSVIVIAFDFFIVGLFAVTSRAQPATNAVGRDLAI